MNALESLKDLSKLGKKTKEVKEEKMIVEEHKKNCINLNRNFVVQVFIEHHKSINQKRAFLILKDGDSELELIMNIKDFVFMKDIITRNIKKMAILEIKVSQKLGKNSIL